jgi:type I restriction enzyme S subunit
MQVGFPFKSAKFLDQSEHAVRLLRGDNIGQGLLRWDGAKHWPEAEVEAVASYHVAQGDVVLAMDRPWIEAGLKFAYVRPSDMPCLLVQRVTRMRGTATLETDFLRHVIASPAFTGYVKSITTGVNVPHISGKDIKKFQFPLPPLDTQRRIASILGAYDDLIEVNRRRIAVLEEMARGLFEEWFVRFHFPGHEAVPILESQDGPLPEGWTWRTLGELCPGKTGIQTGPFGSQLHQEDYALEGVPVVMPKNIIDLRIQTEGIARIPDDLAQSLARHLMDAGDIVYGRRGDIGRRAFISKREAGFFCGTGCLRLRPDQQLIAPRYLFSALGTAETEGAIKARATGATMPNLSAGVMKDVPVLVPDRSIQREFDALAEPNQSLVGTLISASRALAASRDLLLPRLVSGQLSVADAERKLEVAA